MQRRSLQTSNSVLIGHPLRHPTLQGQQIQYFFHLALRLFFRCRGSGYSPHQLKRLRVQGIERRRRSHRPPVCQPESISKFGEATLVSQSFLPGLHRLLAKNPPCLHQIVLPLRPLNSTQPLGDHSSEDLYINFGP